MILLTSISPTAAAQTASSVDWASPAEPTGGTRLGQRDDSPNAVATRPREIGYQLDLRGSHSFDSSFDNAGDIGVSRTGAEVGVSVPLNARADLSFSFMTEASVYRFDGASPLPAMFGPGDPISSAVEHQFGALLALHQNERLTWLIGGAIDLSYELGAGTNDAITWGGVLGISYKVSDTLRLGVLATVSTDLDDELFYAGFPSIDWAFAERWRLHSTQRGLLSVSYQATDDLAVSLDAGFERRQFRLDDDGPLADGILTDGRVPLGIGLRWTPTPRTVLAARVGAFVWQQYEFVDADDNEVLEENADPAAYLMLGFTVRF